MEKCQFHPCFPHLKKIEIKCKQVATNREKRVNASLNVQKSLYEEKRVLENSQTLMSLDVLFDTSERVWIQVLLKTFYLA